MGPSKTTNCFLKACGVHAAGYGIDVVNYYSFQDKVTFEKVQTSRQNEFQIYSTVMHTLEMRFLPLVCSL